MLKLSAAHLREQRRQAADKRLVWLDIGGGTGWNVEEMDKVRPFPSPCRSHADSTACALAVLPDRPV